MPSVRNSIKAVIIRDGRILLTQNRDERGEFYLLPGGGQEWGETMAEALHRECREEIGCAVDMGKLLIIREYIGKNHQFSERDGAIHQVEYLFACTLPEGEAPGEGTHVDDFQAGVVWMPLEQLGKIPFIPETAIPLLTALPIKEPPVYLGDCP